MYKNTVYLVLVFFACFETGSFQNQKIHIDVLYESLCPDSIEFITKQLYPAWNEIAPYVDIKLIPFGKSASINGGKQFVCQHGQKECLGNKIQSCALSALPDPNARIEYVNCFMKTFIKNRRNKFELGQSCANAVGLNWEYVTHCYKSEMGQELQLQAEQDTAKVAPKFVPTIVFNGEFNQLAQDDSLGNFKGVVCAFVSQIYPNGCQLSSILRI